MELFENCTVGGISMKNRIVRSATHDGLADPANEGPSEELIRKYVYLAKNDVGCIIQGYAIVSPDGRSNYPRCLGFFNPDAADGYKKLTAAVHEAGAAIVAQLAHCGRQTSSKAIGIKKIAPTAKRHLLYPDKAREMTKEDITRVKNDFVSAIVRAKEYGYDGAQLHLAHGYLLHDFISENGNKRKDEYGGSLENRMRIVKEILTEARTAVSDFPIWVKLSATDKRRKGMRVDYAVKVAKLLEEYGVDAIEVSCGSVHDGMNTMRSKRFPMDAIFAYREPLASMPRTLNRIVLAAAKLFNPLIPQPRPLRLFNVPAAYALQKEVKTDLIVVGGISDVEEMRKLVADGMAAVSMCRPFICEPNFARKLKNGECTKSQCIMCNCCGLVIEKEPTRCLMGKVTYPLKKR